MTLARLSCWTLLAAIGFALAVPKATAQDALLPARSAYDAAVSAMNGYKEKDKRGIDKDELPTAKRHFASFAKFNADLISHPLIYKAAQDPATKEIDPAASRPTGRTIPTLDSIIYEMHRFVLEPSPTSSALGDRPTDRGDYIREFGIAMDAALKPIIESSTGVVRINAMRMLATAAKSGATAHYPTITGLLTNPNLPPEVKHYALVAAGNLLSAYDIYDYKSRRHSNGWKQPQNVADEELAALVIAIEKCVLDPNAILGMPPIAKTPLTLDQEDVVKYIRRQAIKALGQVRFAAIPGPNGSTLYPAFTLTRICVSDPAIIPAPTPSECAEAAIGLCNMSPNVNGGPIKGYNETAAVEAITAGLISFVGKRAEDPLNRDLPWRGYGLRLSDSLKNWRALFDPLFNPAKPNQFNAAAVPASVNDLLQRTQTSLFTPLEKVIDGKPDLVGGRVEIEKLKEFLQILREKPDRKPQLFIGIDTTKLPIQDKK